MKKTFKYLIYLGMFILILISMEHLYHYLILNNKNLKPSYVLTEKVNADVLIHGNCTPYFTLSPNIVEEQTSLTTYNLAEHNADYAENYLALTLYLQNNKAPKYMILHASPATFDDRYEFFNSYRYSNYMDNKIVEKTIAKLDPSYYKWTSIPFMKYTYYSNQFNFNAFQGALHILQKRKTPYLKNGHNPISEYEYNSYYNKGKYFIWSERKEEYLIKIIELAKKKNIKLILYESPLYTKEANLQVNRGATISKIHQTIKPYKIDYLVFDTMQLSNDKKNFSSTSRLVKKAARKFNYTFCKVFKEHVY